VSTIIDVPSRSAGGPVYVAADGRTGVSVTPVSGSVYYGADNTVTTGSGTVVPQGKAVSLSFGAWFVSAAGARVLVDEAASSTAVARGNLVGQPAMLKILAGKGATVLVVGDSTGDGTGEWPEQMSKWLATLDSKVRVEFTTWGDGGSTYPSTTVVQAGDGTMGTVVVYNCSVGGKTTQYFLAPYFGPMISDVQADLVFVNLGHNHTTGAAEPFFRDDLTALVERITLTSPNSEVVLLTQNPRTDSSAVQQADRRHTIYKIAGTLGVGVIDTYRLFVLPDGSANASYLLDALHPNLTAEQLMWSEIRSHLTPAAGEAARTQDDSALLFPVTNLLTNGDFASFSSPPTLPNWTATSCTPSKDVTNYEGPNGWAVRLQSAAAATSYIEQAITGNALRPLLGQWVTLAAVGYIPSGQNSNVGRVHLRTTGAANNPSQNSTATTQGQGGFRLVTTSIRVPRDAGTLTARLYCENGTTNTGDVSWDRATLAKGARPRDIR
jgi:lysophospholipase L1-like esterase